MCVAALAVLAGCGNKSRKAEEAAAAAEQAAADSIIIVHKAQKTAEKLASMPEEPVFNIITNFGEIKVKLYADTPKHRENFAKLAFDGFYDGLMFHRIINGFMIQTGDPLSKDEANKAKWGTGGPGYNVPAEILPDHTHKKGALAAARRGDQANPLRESSGSQFYIVQGEASFLDGQYTVFGETLSGLDVIDKIAAVQTDDRDCPTQPVRIVTIKLVED